MKQWHFRKGDRVTVVSGLWRGWTGTVLHPIGYDQIAVQMDKGTDRCFDPDEIQIDAIVALSRLA